MSHQHYNHGNSIISATPHKVSFLLPSKCCSYSESVLGNTAQGVTSTTLKCKFLPTVGTLLAVLQLHPIFNSVYEKAVQLLDARPNLKKELRHR